MVQKRTKILLHACCAICSGYPIELLRELNYEPIVYFCNPNLESTEEFNKRLDAQRELCRVTNTELIVDNYDHDCYISFVKGLENEPERGKRCDKCIELRLLKTAQKAKELNVNIFTTSLTISPHKNFAKITSIGEECAKANNTKYLPIDFKKKDGFLKTNRISKDINLYRQKFCGCEFANFNKT